MENGVSWIPWDTEHPWLGAFNASNWDGRSLQDKAQNGNLRRNEQHL